MGCWDTTKEKLDWWTWTYLLDYASLLCVYIVAFGVGGFAVPNSYLQDHLDDMSITQLKFYNFPSKPEYYPPAPTYVGMILGTIVFLCFCQVWKRSGHDCHNAILGFITTFCISFATHNLLKVWFGQLRPDFLNRCEPNHNFDCTNDDDDEVEDGRKSFPSGHATDSFAMMGYLTLYLLSSLQPFNRRRGDGLFFKLVICLIPLYFAANIASTRVTNFRHHMIDVFWGMVFGLLSCFIAIALYYPPFWNKNAHKPLRRKQTTFMAVFWKPLDVDDDDDEEDGGGGGAKRTKSKERSENNAEMF